MTPHALPAAHITYADGVALKAFMAAHPGTEAALSGSVADIKDANGDIMAAFSSRGPNRAVVIDQPVRLGARRGHPRRRRHGQQRRVALHLRHLDGQPAHRGCARAAQGLQLEARTWTPAEAQSALMTTAERDITDTDGTAADWFDMGSGRIELRRAAKAGLVLDETSPATRVPTRPWVATSATLNTASMADDECLQTCDWTRTFTGTSTGVGTWTVSVENRPRRHRRSSTDKTTVAVTDGGDVDVTVTATLAAGVRPTTWLFGTLVLTPPAGSRGPGGPPARGRPALGRRAARPRSTSRPVVTPARRWPSDLEAIAITDLAGRRQRPGARGRVELSIARGHHQPRRVRRQRHARRG